MCLQTNLLPDRSCQSSNVRAIWWWPQNLGAEGQCWHRRWRRRRRLRRWGAVVLLGRRSFWLGLGGCWKGWWSCLLLDGNEGLRFRLCLRLQRHLVVVIIICIHWTRIMRRPSRTALSSWTSLRLIVGWQRGRFTSEDRCLISFCVRTYVLRSCSYN